MASDDRHLLAASMSTASRNQSVHIISTFFRHHSVHRAMMAPPPGENRIEQTPAAVSIFCPRNSAATVKDTASHCLMMLVGAQHNWSYGDHVSVSCSYSPHIVIVIIIPSCVIVIHHAHRIISTASHSITSSCVCWIISGYPTTWSQWIDIKPFLLRMFCPQISEFPAKKKNKNIRFAERHVARLRGSTELLFRSGMWIHQSRRAVRWAKMSWEIALLEISPTWGSK